MSDALPQPANSTADTSNRPANRDWANSALLVCCIAAAAFVVAAFCLASLTWDGSYYFYGTVQDGTPMVPHHRWLNWILLSPVLWARPAFSTPAGLAVFHGLMCSLLPLASLAVCLRMLRGKFAHLRFWAVIGILLVPLPGQMVMVGEVTPALQLGWVCLAFVWCGCPWRWSPAAILAGIGMWGLHPVTAPVFFYGAATAAALSFAADSPTRRHLWLWTALFGIASIAKAAETVMIATDYERANMHGAAWISECLSGLLMTSFLALVPALIDIGRTFCTSFRTETVARVPRLSKSLWIAAGVIGVAYSLYPGGWAGSLSYRKFGIILATPVILMAGIEAWRQWRNSSEIHSNYTGGNRPLIYPAVLFALILCSMSLSWKYLCGSLMNDLATHNGPVHVQEYLSPLARDTALDHWSTTSLSLILQGWNPEKVHVWNRQLQLTRTGLQICPGDEIRWEDKSFKVGWAAKLRD